MFFWFVGGNFDIELLKIGLIKIIVTGITSIYLIKYCI